MKNPTVSIIIPVYNAEGTITRCLDSIIHQTYSSIEVIIIDDGSSDLSGSICDNYATKYNYIHKLIYRQFDIFQEKTGAGGRFLRRSSTLRNVFSQQTHYMRFARRLHAL